MNYLFENEGSYFMPKVPDMRAVSEAVDATQRSVRVTIQSPLKR